jgi:hypothetical protein
VFFITHLFIFCPSHQYIKKSKKSFLSFTFNFYCITYLLLKKLQHEYFIFILSFLSITHLLIFCPSWSIKHQKIIFIFYIELLLHHLSSQKTTNDFLLQSSEHRLTSLLNHLSNQARIPNLNTPLSVSSKSTCTTLDYQYASQNLRCHLATAC